MVTMVTRGQHGHRSPWSHARVQHGESGSRQTPAARTRVKYC